MSDKRILEGDAIVVAGTKYRIRGGISGTDRGLRLLISEAPKRKVTHTLTVRRDALQYDTVAGVWPSALVRRGGARMNGPHALDVLYPQFSAEANGLLADLIIAKGEHLEAGEPFDGPTTERVWALEQEARQRWPEIAYGLTRRAERHVYAPEIVDVLR